MKFRNREQPEPDDGLEARLTADGDAWWRDTSSTFTDSPAALPPGVTGVEMTPEEEPAASGDDEHDEDPTVAAPTRGTWARRAPLLMAAAVIALVAAVTIPLVANRSRTAAPAPAPATPVAAPQCPRTDGGPLVDTGSVKPAEGSLVPAEAPLSMLICEYPLPIQPDPMSAPSRGDSIDVDYQNLRKSRTITVGLASVADDLSRYSVVDGAGCDYFAAWSDATPPPTGSEFRVALRYPTGVVWLGDSTGPNTCLVADGSASTSTGSYADLFLRALGSGTWAPSDRSSVECPLQVDATPYAGTDALPKPAVDTDGRLVPVELPSAVVACGFGQVQPELQPKANDVPEFDLPIGFISQRFELQGNFSPLISELRAAPSADPSTTRCPSPTDSPTPQLLGLTYGAGAQRTTIWVDARIGGTCGLTTNGAVWASGGTPESVRVAMQERSWAGMNVIDLRPSEPGAMPSAPQTSAAPGPEPASTTLEPDQSGAQDAPSSLSPGDEACVTPRFGGPGLSEVMIPAEYTSVYSCTRGVVDIPPALVDAINALAELPVTTTCAEPAPELETGQSSFLVFLYPDREPVPVFFSRSCAPSISNGNRAVVASEAVLDELFALDGS